MEEHASLMGCGMGKLPKTYIDLQLGTSFKASMPWGVVEEIFPEIFHFGSLSNSHFAKMHLLYLAYYLSHVTAHYP